MNVKDYTYNLPDEKIARFPLEQRDHARLLVYHLGEISHSHFYDLPTLLPENSLLFFNDTKVIPARLHFIKDTGAHIEIFLLTPHQPSIISHAMQAIGQCIWKCTIGNLKRWKTGTLVKEVNGLSFEATLTNPEEGIVHFAWSGDLSFGEVIEQIGEIPLPPYLDRKPETTDRERYQTIYSHYQGAVAAPTAGLHFTDAVMQTLKNKGIQSDFITLHVSAGTFQPIKTEDATAHTMHREQIVVNRKNVENLLAGKFIVPIGTTSMRTLESIYWWGTKLLSNRNAEFIINQEDPYQQATNLPHTRKVLEAVANYMDENNLITVTGYSSIYIRPGYKFKICDALITNFHQPSSTLILLVAAFVGRDWEKVYQEAINKNYRFLSYGDSSLLFPVEVIG